MENQKIIQSKIEQALLEKQASEAKKGFKVNLAAYAVVNSMLVTINMLTVPQFPWFLFPLCGWGFGLTMHYIFGVRLLGKKSENTKDGPVKVRRQLIESKGKNRSVLFFGTAL